MIIRAHRERQTTIRVRDVDRDGTRTLQGENMTTQEHYRSILIHVNKISPELATEHANIASLEQMEIHIKANRHYIPIICTDLGKAPEAKNTHEWLAQGEDAWDTLY